MDDSQRRALLRAGGIEPPKRGALNAEWRARADQLAGAEAAPDDYGDGTSEADFLEADDPEEMFGPPGPGPGEGAGRTLPPPEPAAEPAPGGTGPPGAAPHEERPSRPHRARVRLPWHPRPGGGAKAPKGGKRFKRVSVAPLIEDAYADLAWAAAGIPPLQRLLYAQAPLAGAILDPVVKDTVADRVVLQAMARNYERMKVGMALLGTPAALMTVLATAPGPVVVDGQPAVEPMVIDGQPVLGEDGEPVLMLRMNAPTLQHQSAMLSLRYCVRAMADLSGDAMKRVAERAEENAERDSLVDEFMAFLLGVEVPQDRAQRAKDEGSEAGLKLAGVASQ